MLKASNQGIPVIHDERSEAGQAYADAISRLLGEEVEHRFLTVQNRGFIKRFFRRTA